MKKIKKPLHQRTFLIFITLSMDANFIFIFLPLPNGDFCPKKYAEKN